MTDFVLPRFIGHRGAAALAPENTLAAFRAAKAAGVTMVEFDVQLSVDGVPVVIHDKTLERTTNGSGPVAARTAAELTALDAGAWFGPGFAGERLPTLEAVVAELGALGLGANIEFKSDGMGARAMVEIAMRLLDRLWPAHLPPPLLSSFDPACATNFREVAPDLPRAFLVGPARPEDFAAAKALGCVAFHLNHDHLNEKLTAMIKNEGWRCVAYTVDDPARAGELLAWGVDSIVTNAPDRLIAALGAS